MRIATTIRDIEFTSEIPDVELRSPERFVRVAIRRHGEPSDLFSTRLYPAGGKVLLQDIATVIEDDLIARHSSSGVYSITAIDNSNEATVEFTAIYSDDVMGEDAGEWTLTHFFNDLPVRRTWRDAPEHLTWFALEGESTGIRYKVTLRYGDVYRTIGFPSAPATASAQGDVSVDVSYSVIHHLVSNMNIAGLVDITGNANDWDEIVAWTVTVGDRSATYYIDESTEDAGCTTIGFRNNFNAEDYANFRCVRTNKSKTSKSTANVGRYTVQYDIKSETSSEVETGPLQEEEASWIARLGLARECRLKPTGETDMSLWPVILIDEGSIDISNSGVDAQSVKLSWRQSDERCRRERGSKNVRIFGVEYDNTYS